MAKQQIKKKRRRGNIGRIISIIMVVLSGSLALQIYLLQVLPTMYLVPIDVIVVTIALLAFIFRNFKAKGFQRFICSTLCLLLTVGYGLGNYYVFKTNQMFKQVTNLTDKTTNTISVTVMADSKIEELSDLKGKTVGIMTNVDPVGTEKAMQELDRKGPKFQTVEYDTIFDAAGDLYDGFVDAIVLNDAYLGMLHDEEVFTLFTTQTKQIHQTIFYTDREYIKDVTNDRTKIDEEPFTVLISGNDTYGSLNDVSRSDVNMLVTINPSSHTIMMTSIPRDYYVELAGDENYVAVGQMDKLTHTGLHGIETTEATLEQLLGININYTVRVNFSSLVNLVNALGGIDVVVDEGLAVDTFYANNTLEGVHEGKNHLDGERALAFARERHAYEYGDNQRVINQQIVLKAIIKKMASPAMIVRYAKFVDAIGGAFETDMPAEDISDFLKFEIARFPNWKFEAYALAGFGSNEFCNELGGYAYVTIPDDVSVAMAAQKLQAVLEGKSSDTVNENNVVVPEKKDEEIVYYY